MPSVENMPRSFGPKKNIDNKAGEDNKTPEQKNIDAAQKNTIDFIKIIVATIKNQSPDKQADPGQIAQTMAVMKQTEEIIKMGGNISSLKDKLSSDELGRISSMYSGKEVRFNTATQIFDGQNPVAFKYQMNIDDATKPVNASIVSSVSVHNSAGIEVMKTIGKREKGIHEFNWDGKDSKGKLVKKGEYTIKINAHYEKMNNGQVVKTPIESGAYISGRVDSVELSAGKPKLRANNLLFDLDQVIKIESEINNETTENLILSDYSSYIGKFAEISNNEVNINASGESLLDFECKIDRPGKVLIRLFDEKDNHIGCALIDEVDKGMNHLRFKPTNSLSPEGYESFEIGVNGGSYLPQGKYKYKIFIQDTLNFNPEEYKEVIVSKKIKITGLDFANEPLVISGEEKFSLSSIKKLSEDLVSNIYNDYTSFLGKVANVNFETFELRNNSPAQKQYVKIAPVGNGYVIGDVYMNIFDANNILVNKIQSNTVISTSQNTLYNRDTLLSYIKPEDLSELKAEHNIPMNLSSIDEIEEFFGNSDEDRSRFTRFADKVFQKLDTVAIAKEYWPEFENLQNNDRDLVLEAVQANCPFTSFYWNGRNMNGDRVPEGSYRYEFEMEKYKPSDADRDRIVERIYDIAKVKISEYTKDTDGEISFCGNPYDATGSNVTNHVVKFSPSQISSLQVA